MLLLPQAAKDRKINRMPRFISVGLLSIVLGFLSGCGDDLPDLDFKQEMVDFVIEISIYAKSEDSSFLIFPQNNPDLWAEQGYLDAVDGIGQEELYYGYDGDGEATPSEVTSQWEEELGHFRDKGKLVLTVDYPFDDPEIPSFTSEIKVKIDDAYSSSQTQGFVPYCAVRELSHLTVNPGHEPGPNAEPVNSLDEVAEFIYILQHDESLTRSRFLDSLGSRGFDLIVMDHADNDGLYTTSEIATLKQESGAIILAYMSIGEAEDYRFYWKEEWSSKRNRPDWIEGENPDWEGNYLVRYWEDAWKQIIFGTDSSYLDIIISQGFDGVYLDKIDAYEEF
jgi:cysteinyl-tRNA synthetase